MKNYPITGLPGLFLFISILLFTITCGSSGSVTDSEFENLEYLVNSDESGYTLQISGFSDPENALYKESLKRLNRYSPGQVTEITESGQQNMQLLSARIVDDPRSVNRVLWLFGTEIYRRHHLDYEKEIPVTGFTIMSSMPELIGGLNEFQKQVRYPSVLEGSGIEGRVDLQFIVNEYGEVEDPEVIQGLHESADREAIRVIRESKFKPGMVDGLPVRVQYKMPVFFRER